MNTSIVVAAASLEVIIGICFVILAGVVCRLLFAVAPEGLPIALLLCTGVLVLGLCIVCLCSNLDGPRRGAVRALLVFNFGTAVFFASIAVHTFFRGVLHWPYVASRAFIVAALLPQFLGKGSRQLVPL